jgi:serine protease inhibitor
MRKYFKTNIETVDFTNVEEARRLINSQVKADTDGKITELMSYGLYEYVFLLHICNSGIILIHFY